MELKCRPYFVGWLSGPGYIVYIEKDKLRIYDRNLSTKLIHIPRYNNSSNGKEDLKKLYDFINDQ